MMNNDVKSYFQNAQQTGFKRNASTRLKRNFTSNFVLETNQFLGSSRSQKLSVIASHRDSANIQASTRFLEFFRQRKQKKTTRVSAGKFVLSTFIDLRCHDSDCHVSTRAPPCDFLQKGTTSHSTLKVIVFAGQSPTESESCRFFFLIVVLQQFP